MGTATDQHPTISRIEAARRLDVTEQSVIYWEKQGYITPTMDGRKTVYPVTEVVAQARKNVRLREAADKLAADVGLNDAPSVTVAATAAGDAVVERQRAEIGLLRERVEAQEREIERLHLTLQRLAER